MTALAGTEVEAANLALGHLRQPPIASLDVEKASARAVKTFFAAARDAAFRLQWWNFATGYNKPAQGPNFVSDGPRKLAFVLPGDCIAVRSVENAGTDSWEVMAAAVDPAGSTAEVNVLVTNITAPVICYTRRIIEPRLWTGDFLAAFAFQLAAFAGGQLGASSARIRDLQAQADQWKADAAEVDAGEKAPSQVSRSTSWTQSRRLGGSRCR